MGFLLGGPQAATALTGGSLPRSLNASGVMTLADGTTRTFTSPQAASIRQTLAGQTSLYAQTQPPAGSYVLDPGTRAKILAGQSADAPATRRGFLKLAEKFNLRKGLGLFGPVQLLASANLAVWSHNAGVLGDELGWFRGQTPPASTARVDMQPVTRGQRIQNASSSNGGEAASIDAPTDGYILTPKTATATNVNYNGAYEYDYSQCQGRGPGSGWPQGLAGLGTPYISGAAVPCSNYVAGTQRLQVFFVSADPKPHATNPGATGARVGTSPTAPTTQTQPVFDANAGAVLAGTLTDDEGHALAEAIAEAGLGSSPMVSTVNVPSCTGDLWAACHQKMQEAGLTTTHTVETFTGADLERPPNYVLQLVPAGGATVDAGSNVTVRTNPDTDDMPLAIPAPELGETYETYTTRLAELGHVGTTTRVDLSETTMDPTRGPSAVTGTEPTVTTRIAPDAPVRIRVNPSTAPTVGSGTPLMPDVPSINLAPLSASSPCNKFPFGVPCWVVGALGGFGGGSNCPSFDVPLGQQVFGDPDMDIDLCVLQPAVDIVRPLILIAAFLGLGWLFMGAAMGFGGRGGDD